MTIRPDRRDAGFTLLELLVALVVFGLVLAGLTQSFRFGLTAVSIGARNTAGPEALAALDAALTRMIAQAVPGSMTGGAGRLAFTTRLPAGAGLGAGLADAAILLAPGGTLLLRYTPHPPGVPLIAPPPPQTELLASGITAFAASYLLPKTGAPPAWSNQWSGNGLPLLVRIHLGVTAQPNWPDLVAAPVGAGN